MKNSAEHTGFLHFLFNITDTMIDELFINPHFSEKFRGIVYDGESYGESREQSCLKFYFELTEHNRDKLVEAYYETKS